MIILAFLAAANPFRVAVAAGRRVDAPRLAAFSLTFVGLTFVASVAAGPLLDLVDVTGSSARIAAGIALLVVSIRDAVARPPHAEPSLNGAWGGAIPLAFPIMFSPAAALVAVAAADDRGVALALLGALPALVAALALLRLARLPRPRLLVSTTGMAAAGIAGLLILDGVYAI